MDFNSKFWRHSCLPLIENMRYNYNFFSEHQLTSFVTLRRIFFLGGGGWWGEGVCACLSECVKRDESYLFTLPYFLCFASAFASGSIFFWKFLELHSNLYQKNFYIEFSFVNRLTQSPHPFNRQNLLSRLTVFFVDAPLAKVREKFHTTLIFT